MTRIVFLRLYVVGIMYYDIVHKAAKGRSVVAREHIPAGTIILKERPIIVAEDVYDALYSLYALDDSDEEEEQENNNRQRQRQEAFEALVPTKIDKAVPAYADLVADMATLPAYMREFFGMWKPDRLRLLVAKFQRNAFTYTSPPCAILTQGTLLNHSCCNNVDFHVDSRGTFVFETNRDVHAGEELCDRYIEVNLSVKKRLKMLYGQYGFICNCVKCRHGR